MPDSATCRDCGTTFTVTASVQERFPGWTPTRCRSCHRAHSGAGSSSSTSSRARRSAATITGADHVASGVFTDGSATPNPGPGGWGVVWVEDDRIIDQASGTAPDTTNNRMELTALIEAVNMVPEGTAATLYSDSNLAVRTVNEWAAGWKRRGWKRKGGPVENLDLVRELYELLQGRPELDVQWIKAHAGHRWNEYADRLASGDADPG